MAEYLIVKTPIQVNRLHINTIYKCVEISLNIKLSSKGKRMIRKDIDRYLLIFDNQLELVIEYFQNYKDNLKTVYQGYDETALNNIIREYR
jgi:hypothetical protein